MPYGYGPMGPRASTTRPAVSSDPYGVQTWFKDASAPGAKDGTVIPASWLNTIIGERLHLAQSAGIAVNSNLPNDALLADSVTAIANARVAAGTAAAVIVARLDAYLGAGWRATLTGSQIVDAIDGALSSTNWRSFNPDTYWRKDQDIVSPTFVGTPTAPTAALGTDTDQIATMAAIKDAIDELAAAKQAAHDRLSDIAGIAWAQGDIAYFNGTNLVRLPAGTDGHFLKTRGAGANPEWAAGGGGSFSGGDLLSALGIIAGAAVTPGLYFDGDTNTGLWSPGADIIGFATAGVARARFNASGHLTFDTDNSYDIGQSGANRPRTIYVAGNIYSGNWLFTPAGLLWANGSNITSPSSGVITAYNNGNTDFGRLQFGGTTSSFPALKKSGATLQARLADDSAFTEFKASVLECGTSIKFPDATTQTTAFAPYTGSTELETVFPVGHTVIVDTSTAVAKNSTTTIYAGNSGTGSDSRYNIAATGSALTGTWRSRGSVGGYTIYERVA